MTLCEEGDLGERVRILISGSWFIHSMKSFSSRASEMGGRLTL